MTYAPQGTSITILQPDDWHIHLRDGEMLETVVGFTAAQFKRVTAMPNLLPPVTTVEMAEAYVERIKKAANVPGFEPYVPLYLTDATSPEEIKKAKDSTVVHALKYYPAGATTNSDNGITKFENLFPILEAAEKLDVPFQMHGEVMHPEVDVFDRERVFVDKCLSVLAEKFPALRMVLEHNTTKEAVEFINGARDGICGSITPIHLMYNRNDLLGAGVNPHLYCAPIVKEKKDQEMLVAAATSGNARFFAGTDSAPHLRANKEAARGHFGAFSAPYALNLYAMVFDIFGGGLHTQETLKNFEAFMSVNGANFYQMPVNTDTVTLVKEPFEAAASFPVSGGGEVVPLNAGEVVSWAIQA